MLTKAPATRDLGRVVEDGPPLERRQRRLDLAQALIDLLGISSASA